MMWYKSKDFGADRLVTYRLFREAMACIYGSAYGTETFIWNKQGFQ